MLGRRTRFLLFVVGFGSLLIFVPLMQALGAVTIKFVGMEYYEWTGPWFEDTTRQFEKQNPGVRVKSEIIPWDAGFDRYLTWIKAGTPPDAGWGGAKWVCDFIAMDALEPLDAYMSPEFRNNLVESFLETTTIAGQCYALVMGGSPRGMYYNVGILDKAGVAKFPTTWIEFLLTAEKISNLPDVYAYAYDMADHEAIWDFRPWLLSAGGGLLTNDEWKVNTPQNIEAVEFVNYLIKRKLTQPGVTGTTRPQKQRIFLTEKAAMMHETVQVIERIKMANPKMKFDVSKFPKYRTFGTISLADVSFLFKGKNTKTAWKFMEFLLSDEIYYDWISKLGTIGGTKSILRRWPVEEKAKKFASWLPIAKMYPLKAGWTVVEEEVVAAIQAVSLGTMESKAALDQAQERIEQRLYMQ